MPLREALSEPTATTRPSATSRLRDGLESLAAMRRLVELEGACSLPHVSPLRDDMILPELDAAVAEGLVSESDAAFVREGLRWGFRAGVDISANSLAGSAVFGTIHHP